MPQETDIPNESVFEIPLSVLKNVETVAGFIHSQDYLRATDRETIKLIILLASEKPVDNYGLANVGISELIKALKHRSLPSHKTTVLNKARNYVQYGLFQSTTVESLTGGQPRIKFTMEAVHKASFKSSIDEELEQRVRGRKVTRRSRTNSKKIITYLQESDAQYLKALSASKHNTENFFTGILDRAMRFTTSEQIEGNIIQNEITHNGTKIIVQATTKLDEARRLPPYPTKESFVPLLVKLPHTLKAKLSALAWNTKKRLLKNSHRFSIPLKLTGIPDP